MVIHTLGSPTTPIRPFGYFSLLILVLLLMVIDHFNGCAHVCSLGITSKIKIIGESSLVFICLWFGLLWLPLEKYKVVLWKKKEFKDLKDLLMSFRLYFVIVRDSSSISTM
jgi:hypothetical protein